MRAAGHGAVEEQEIEEEEVDLASYGEERVTRRFRGTEEETHAPAESIGIGCDAARSWGVALEPAANGEALPRLLLKPKSKPKSEKPRNWNSKSASGGRSVVGGGSDWRRYGGCERLVRVPAPEAMLVQRTQPVHRSVGPMRNRSSRGRRAVDAASQSRETVVPQISELLKKAEVLIKSRKNRSRKGCAHHQSYRASRTLSGLHADREYTGVSRKIASEEERQRLKRIIQSERENGAAVLLCAPRGRRIR